MNTTNTIGSILAAGRIPHIKADQFGNCAIVTCKGFDSAKRIGRMLQAAGWQRAGQP